MSVRAKFKVDSILHSKYGDEGLKTINLSPVYGGSVSSHENAQFWKWTPIGKIELGTINEAAAEQFEIGKEYYIDFTKAE